jgi:hypothetical protein
VDRDEKNPFDIEHIWASHYALHSDVFASQQEFEQLRDTVPALLLLPADVNRSLQDKPYDYKLQKYATHHLYTASLAPSAYANQPQFDRAQHLEAGRQDRVPDAVLRRECAVDSGIGAHQELQGDHASTASSASRGKS